MRLCICCLRSYVAIYNNILNLSNGLGKATLPGSLYNMFDFYSQMPDIAVLKHKLLGWVGDANNCAAECGGHIRCEGMGRSNSSYASIVFGSKLWARTEWKVARMPSVKL
jgi:hypothetical protein